MEMQRIYITDWYTDKGFDTLHETDNMKSQAQIREALRELIRGEYGYVRVWQYEFNKDFGLDSFDIEALVGQLVEKDFNGAEMLYEIEIDSE